LLFHTLMGTLLVASGTGTLNQYLERRTDGLMRRTANRPLPAGRLRHWEALWFGIFLAIAGGAELWIAANPLTSALALATLATYLIFYTPLKRQTPLCTVVGAFPGAVPPLIGWAAVRNGLSPQAWVLYAILSYGNSPTCWRSPGCIGRIMPAQDCRCCRATTTTAAPPHGRLLPARWRFCP
jgi:protoheme IX farnesyltransferase